MIRIGSMLLICALLAGCGCIARTRIPRPPAMGQGLVLKDNTSDGAEEDG